MIVHRTIDLRGSKNHYTLRFLTENGQHVEIILGDGSNQWLRKQIAADLIEENDKKFSKTRNRVLFISGLFFLVGVICFVSVLLENS